MDIFEECAAINELLQTDDGVEARNRLIRLLDSLGRENQAYNPLLNHLIRESGLYPYLEPETSSWQDRFVYESFKVDIGQDEPVTLHSEQSLVLKHLLDGDDLAVSAPTSFGKSLIIDAYIAIKKPTNVLILVPTIALTDETRRRLNKKFSGEYKIVTTSEVELGERNILIFPQERAIHYCDKLEQLDLLVVDEFYKASQAFDKERSPALLKAMLKLGEKAAQKYYLAPNIADLNDNPFTKGMTFLRMDFNTVFLEKHEEYKDINKNVQKKNDALLRILGKQETKSLIYAGTYSGVDSVTTLLVDNADKENSALLSGFSAWLAMNYHPNWKLTNLVKRGVGIHTGQLHRSLSQIQVRLFEEEKGGLQTLVSTSSIIEGVNTSAENVIVWSNKKGKLKLDDFTYRNIIGRGGRMFRHFVGNIYILEEPPIPAETQLELMFPDELLADVDDEKYKQELTKEQLAKLLHYKEEMSQLMGQESFERLRNEGMLISSDTELIATIAFAIKKNPRLVRGLANLYAPTNDYWVWTLCNVLKLVPGGWDAPYAKFAEFVRALSSNWNLTIPELLDQLSEQDVTIDEFFKMERNATFKLTALLNDVNVIQKEIVPVHKIDISPFIAKLSKAFLPSCVMELEEYGLPRMLAKRITASGLINFEDEKLDLHSAIKLLRELKPEIFAKTEGLDDFDRYVLDYFYEGIAIQ
ncbi:DEAD/DEAH box helicase [Nitrosomonas sp.]|uniref:DEAD/DEAH box helicase n=1 Tax=Nitrosomonas sp. TaxID=42353 RepID=UPI001D22DC8B|nr:DEAD/DEAH box helicase [Nitrosomonas sp.]MBX3615601.1 DEAD/DEAH box helicase [Nitrosomonas sp.]